MALKHTLAFALIFLVAVTTARFSASRLFEADEFRRARRATVAGSTLTGKTVESVASSYIASPGVVVSIENTLPDTELKGGQIYERYGQVKLKPPTIINPNTQEIAAFESARWGGGTTGMIAYNIMDPKNPVRFLIFFAIPWSRALHSNWYGLSFIADGQLLDSQFYSNIYYHPAWKTHMTESAFGYGSDGGKLVIEKGSYIITATMNRNARAIMTVKVLKKGGAK